MRVGHSRLEPSGDIHINLERVPLGTDSTAAGEGTYRAASKQSAQTRGPQITYAAAVPVARVSKNPRAIPVAVVYAVCTTAYAER